MLLEAGMFSIHPPLLLEISDLQDIQFYPDYKLQAAIYSSFIYPMSFLSRA